MNQLQFKHNNRLFCDNDGLLEITHKNGRHFSVPDILYKYYPLNKNTADAVGNHYLYASNPTQLNDRFDCDPQLVSFNTLDEEMSVTNNVLPHNPLTIDDLSSLSEFGLNNLLVEYYFKRWGIISLAKRYDEILMWSHYAKDDGIVVGFYIDKLPWDWIGPFPIEYVSKRNTAFISTQQLSLLPLLQCFQKNKKWQYEKEYRYLVKLRRGLSRKISYDYTAIAEVYLGQSFFRQNEIENEEENFKVTLNTINRTSVFKKRIIDALEKCHIPIYYDLSLYIDELHYEPYHLAKDKGQYCFYYY